MESQELQQETVIEEQVETPVEQPIEQIEQQEVEAEEPAVTAEPEEDQYSSLMEAIKTQSAKITEAERKAEFYRQMVEQQTTDKGEQPFDPEDLADYRGVESIIDQKLSAIQQQQRNMELNNLVKQAQERHPDYDDVYKLAEVLAQENPGLAETIMATPNPAETAYLIGKSHPAYQERAAKQAARAATQKVVQKINSNQSGPQTLTNNGGGPVSQTKDWSQASDEEVEAEYQRVIRQQR